VQGPLRVGVSSENAGGSVDPARTGGFERGPYPRALKLALGIGLACAAAALVLLLVLAGGERAPGRSAAPRRDEQAPGRTTAEGAPPESPATPDAAPAVAAASSPPASPAQRGSPGERAAAVVPGAGRPLRVRVLDAGGSPVAGIRVRLAWHLQARQDESCARTDATGTARFADLERRPLARAPGAVWTAGVEELLAAEPIEQEIAPDPHPEEPIVLRLPPTGALVVEAFEDDGTPVRDGSDLVLRIVRPGAPLEPFQAGVDVDANGTFEHGEVHFARVALGLELEGLSLAGDLAAPPARGEGPGPAREGEEARLTLRRTAATTRLVLRAVDGSGMPLAGRSIATTYIEGTGTLNTGGAASARESDGEGRLSYTVSSALGPGVHRALDLELRAVGAAHVDLTRSFPPGVLDLGDVVLAPPPPAAAGIALDANGAPVAYAQVEATRLDISGLQPREGMFGMLSALTDEEGRFSIPTPSDVDPAQPPRLALHAAARELAADLTPVAFGRTDLVLELRGMGELAGELRTDAGIVPTALEVRAFPVGAEGSLLALEIRTHPDGRFVEPRAVSGTWTVVVSASGKELARVEDVEVAPGGTTDDPRLHPIDLAGQLFEHRVRLLLPDGSTPAALDGAFSFVPHGAPLAGACEGARFQGATLRILSRAPSLDLLLAPRGFRHETVLDVGAERTVALRPGLPVRLVLTEGSALPDPPLVLRPFLADPAAPPDAPRSEATQGFDARRAVTLTAPAPGRLSVGWLLEQEGALWPLGEVVQLGPPQTLEVADTPAEQVFGITIPPAALRTLLEGRR